MNLPTENSQDTHLFGCCFAKLQVYARERADATGIQDRGMRIQLTFLAPPINPPMPTTITPTQRRQDERSLKLMILAPSALNNADSRETN
jgi:hypothetical protein